MFMIVTLHGNREKYQIDVRMQLWWPCIKVKGVKVSAIAIEK